MPANRHGDGTSDTDTTDPAEAQVAEAREYLDRAHQLLDDVAERPVSTDQPFTGDYVRLIHPSDGLQFIWYRDGEIQLGAPDQLVRTVHRSTASANIAVTLREDPDWVETRSDFAEKEPQHDLIIERMPVPGHDESRRLKAERATMVGDEILDHLIRHLNKGNWDEVLVMAMEAKMRDLEAASVFRER